MADEVVQPEEVTRVGVRERRRGRRLAGQNRGKDKRNDGQGAKYDEVSKDAGAAQAISACCQMRTCGGLSISAGIMWLANGSRLSCGRRARRRKGVGRQSVPARAQHSGSLRAISARQLQALVRQLPTWAKCYGVLTLSQSTRRALVTSIVRVSRRYGSATT